MNAYGEFVYPLLVTSGGSVLEVYLQFSDFNDLVFPAYLECLGTFEMGSELVSFGAFSIELLLDTLWPIPYDPEYLSLSSISVTGQLLEAFDGKMYEDEYLKLQTVSVSGTFSTVSFEKRYVDSHLQLSSVSVVGQYCDVNGNPL